MQSINLPSILTPDLGLLFWMLLAFLIVFFLMAKFGFPVITKMVEERKQFIDESLRKAHEANERLAGIREESERLLSEARARQAEILSQAKATGDGIVREARERAQAEGAKLLQEAKAQIEAEKENALRDIRETVADLSVAIAEKVVRQKLADDKEQQKLIERMLDEVC
ncbi:MAG: F0F1 ATP synthase subunit B [Alloprevotella sp.]|nr:F0F1 ATP synthase subunit B [Alloprevotella sp.]